MHNDDYTPPPATPPAEGFRSDHHRYVATHLTGIRSFKVTQAGYLTGVTMRSYQYQPGRNDAVCLNSNRQHRKVDPYDNLVNVFMFMGGMASYRDDRYPNIQPQYPGPESREHDMKKCGCGIYAFYSQYHESALAWKRLAGVQGIVHAHGRTISGEKGFRSAVADLIAICLPTDNPTFTGWESLRLNYPGVEFWTSTEAMLEAHPLSEKPEV